MPAPVVIGTAAAAPVALCVATRRTLARDVGTCLLQMWAYIAAYEMPHDDPAALERRVRVDYPVRVDRALGMGTLPTLRLQRALSTPGAFSAHEKALVWAHWIWFLVPHSSVAYVRLRRPGLFPRAAVMTYAIFDLGAIVYWSLPTAPPWYASRHGRVDDGRMPQLRRMMVEYGEHFWGRGWGPLYDVLGGNPLAAMPSLHFATSVMAAHLLTDTGPVAGAVGWAYAAMLGVALVYLGEHYVADLLAGLALTEVVRGLGQRLAPALERASRAVQALEARAHA
jgi:membrane-associated phospholipid phosphatase